MSSEVLDPLSAWQSLRAESHAAGVIPTKAASTSLNREPVRFGLGPHSRARLLVPLAAGESMPAMPASKALMIGTTDLSLEGGKHCRYLDIICLDGGLDAVFSEVVAEILSRIGKGLPGPAACASTLEDFQSLLLSGGRRKVSKSMRIGLLGELLMLEQLLATDSGCLACWQGPLDKRHDFRIAKRALEVKTSSRPGIRKVSISSIDQLMLPEGGTLLLAHLVLEDVFGGTLTISNSVTRIEKLIGAGTDFRQRLSEMECTDPHHEDWNQEAYVFHGVSYYRVEAGFPRIVPEIISGGQLPPGVENLTYTVDLGVAAPFKMDLDSHTQVLRTFLGMT